MLTTFDNISRITKDINELELPKTCRTEFPGNMLLAYIFRQNKLKIRYELENRLLI